MHAGVIRDVFRSLAAALALLAIVVGVPVMLAGTRGWPLPTAVPSADAVADALGGASISDGVLLDALACLAWLAWALVVWCAAVELRAWSRGRAASRAPGAGAVQLLVRRLVVSATLLLSASRPPAVAHLATAPAPPVVLVSASVSPAEEPLRAVAPALPTCLVQPRDSLWRIAERHLGDPFRWREIYELNHGRTFGDGGVLRDADLIHPGWQLVLPADAVGTAAAAEPVQPPAPQVPAREHAPVEPVTMLVPTPAPEREVEGRGAEAPDHVADDDVVTGKFAAAGLLLAGVVATVNGLRRRQRRLRAAGRAMDLPSPAALSAERTIREAADVSGAERVDLALRALATQARGAPPIDAVRVDGDEIEILFADEADGCEGTFAGVGTRAWTLHPDVPTAALAGLADRGCVSPALIVIGKGDGGDVLVDLEALRCLTVHGERSDVAGLLGSVVLDLATHAWADDVRVVVCGLSLTGVQALDRVEVVADLDGAVEDIAAESRATAAALLREGAESTWDARMAGVGDGWAPIVLVLGPNAPPEDVEHAVGVLHDAPGVAIVAASSSADAPIDDAPRLVVAPGRAHIALLPLGLVMEPAVVPDGLLEAVGEIVAVAAAAEPGPALLDEVEQDVIGLRETTETRASQVIVRVLGRVEIDGGRSVIDRRRVVEFVTLLALHPRGLTEGQIKAALWTDQEPTMNAFNQVVSRARTALGIDSTGEPHVRYVDGCVYKPGPELVTDWALLETAWVDASRDPSDEAIAALRRSLDDVRGLPFEGTKGYEWAYELGLPSRMEAVIDEARAMVDSTAERRDGPPAPGDHVAADVDTTTKWSHATGA